MLASHAQEGASHPPGGSAGQGELRIPEGPGKSGRPKPRALVVDDAPDVTEIFSLLLRKEGYEVVRAHSGADALEAARRERFDLVVSDIGMPGMNGYQLAAALRALHGYEAVPMMAVTGYSRYDDAMLSICAGFDEHMTKPINPSALSSAIGRLRDRV